MQSYSHTTSHFYTYLSSSIQFHYSSCLSVHLRIHQDAIQYLKIILQITHYSNHILSHKKLFSHQPNCTIFPQHKFYPLSFNKIHNHHLVSHLPFLIVENKKQQHLGLQLTQPLMKPTLYLTSKATLTYVAIHFRTPACAFLNKHYFLLTCQDKFLQNMLPSFSIYYQTLKEGVGCSALTQLINLYLNGLLKIF